MSRIGKKQIIIPQGVTVTVSDGRIVVKGPKGELTRDIHPKVKVSVEGEEVFVSVAKEEDKEERSLWGTFGAHVRNMIQGVTQGFKKQMEINGVGYRVAMHGKDLKLEVGFSHPVIFQIPAGITASVEKNLITVEGANKDQVGQVAAEIREIKKPEPYKGKGIKYVDEVIRRKAGKAAKSA